MDYEYKLAKEAFVTGLKGSTLYDVSLAMLVAPLTVLLHRALVNSFRVNYFAEQILVVLPIIISWTCFQYGINLYIAMSILSCILIYYSKNRHPYPENELNATKKLFITNFRSMMMLCTCVAILAIDFPVFPRKFGKTEEYGISLMDVGVGGFIVSLGLVSQKSAGQGSTIFEDIVKTIRDTLPVFILGISRLVAVKFIGYQEHLSEYGVHWNFFFTLAMLSFFGSFLRHIPSRLMMAIIGGLVIVVYQVALTLGLDEYIQNGERTNIISQNKEGICSFLGFLGIFMISVYIGSFTLKNKTKSEWWRQAFNLILFGEICWVIAIIAEHYGILPSRKMANLTYCLHVLVISSHSLGLFLLIELLSHHYGLGNKGEIFEFISNERNSQLVVFLISNVFTGIINLSMKTIYVEDNLAIFIIFSYMFVSLTISKQVLKIIQRVLSSDKKRA
eukprot:TRINITY_DN8839_c0_g1_i1.p1 TRINITY_DN8839_c0_g1~~TRINITY_DN8839_c0_g1_i1.p1  ORF type:complete len:447 (-),score=2.65 TRINITY_DN8839_c0_g1_i1:12-1352(-)